MSEGKKVESEGVDEATLAWEASVGWDHPLVKAGLWPAHLLRESWKYSRRGMDHWCSKHAYLGVKINQRMWFRDERILAWAADPRNAADLHAEDDSAQPRHNQRRRKTST